mgnify:FL=1
MNRLEMQEIIKERVPYLIEQHQEEWKEYEKQRQAFVRDYPIDRITGLTLDEYVIGKGSENRSFCYRIERELDQLGRILGATANKFGVYYGKTKSDATMQYRFASHWGETVNEAFDKVKESISDLLVNADNTDIINQNLLSPMFKGKILFLFHPEKFLNIYSYNHLSHFTAHLNIITKNTKELDLQKSLMDYKATWSELQNVSPFLYGALLYDQFGHPMKDTSQQIPLLSTAVAGASVSNTPTTAKPTRQNPDYEELQRNRKIIGDRGEKIVLELEIKRLKDAGRNDLAERVLHIADTDDSKGFDILSFDDDGTERKIEVKSTSMDSFYKGFFLSVNELEKSKILDNYYLYLVSSAMTNKPLINQIPKPAYSEPEEFTLSPVLYNVRLNNMEAEQ